MSDVQSNVIMADMVQVLICTEGDVWKVAYSGPDVEFVDTIMKRTVTPTIAAAIIIDEKKVEFYDWVNVTPSKETQEKAFRAVLDFLALVYDIFEFGCEGSHAVH